MDYFILQFLIQFINGVSLILTLIPDGTAAVGFVLIYNKLTTVILIYTKSPGILIINSDKESCSLRRRQMPVIIPFFKLFYGMGLFNKLSKRTVPFDTFMDNNDTDTSGYNCRRAK